MSGGKRLVSLSIKGLPQVYARTLWAVDSSATTIWFVEGREVHRYRIHRKSDFPYAEKVCSTELPGEVSKIVTAEDGAFFAVLDRDCETWEIVEIGDASSRAVKRLDREPTAIAATRRSLVFVTPGQGLDRPELIVLGRRDGRVARRLPLASENVRIRVGAGDEVLIAEQGGRLRYVDTSRREDNCGRDPVPPRTPPGQPDDCDKCHAGCGCRCKPPRRPGGHDEVPGDPPRQPNDPDGQCVPGDDGVPDRCWVTTYLNGKVIRINICEPTDPTCVATTGFQVRRIDRTRRALIATSDDGRRRAVLESDTLRVLHQTRTDQAAVAMASAAAADALFLQTEAGEIQLLDAAPLLSLDVAAPVTRSAVHDGESPVTQYSRDGVQVGLRTVLIIPVLEPGQAYTGNTDEIADYYEMQDILARVQDFYEEATYDQQPDHFGLSVRFLWFGAHTPTVYTGPPVRIEKPLKEYWGPAWDPGHIKSSVDVPMTGLMLGFSGDERLEITCEPSPEETYDPLNFTIRFPAASYRSRISNGTPAVTYQASLMPARAIAVDGVDRQGANFFISVDTSILSGQTVLELTRLELIGSTDPLEALADVLEELLESAEPGLFQRPSVVWHDDGDETGMLHVTLLFADAPGGVAPRVTNFNIDDLLNHVGSGSTAATFSIPGDEGTLQSYLRRNVTDAHVRNSEFGPDLSESYFDLDNNWQPWVRLEAGVLETRISLSTKHGRDPAVIRFDNQIGLDQIGMDMPVEGIGADASYSGGGGPKFENNDLFDDVYTAMIDAAIDSWAGPAEAAIDAINRRFNCIGLEQFPFECAFDLIHSVVVTPVYPGPPFSGTSTEPDLVNGERGASKGTTMSDLKAEERAKPVLPISSNRRKIIMKIAVDSATDSDRASRSAGTLAHELGHALLGLPDLYSGGSFRSDVRYMGGHCLMGDSGSFAHFCAYNKRIKGWLDDDAILILDRPSGEEEIDQEVVLIQLEHWDPTFDAATLDAIAQTALSGMAPGTPVKAAVYLRLGGDGRQFDILELRGPGQRFSNGITPPRVVVSNAIDPDDDSRYSDIEVEGAGTTEDVLERYRRKVHLLSSALRETTIGTADATYDFASDPEFPEVGLTVQLLEWGTGSTSSGSFSIARLQIAWERGAAINLGFKDATPDWQSPDIAVIRPEDIDDAGNFEFPEDQEDVEYFRIPPEGGASLPHEIAVKVWNFGDATAENVQIGLIRRRPKGGGGGDWENDAEFLETLPDPVPPSTDQSPPIISFDWEVEEDSETHLCFRAQIGDRDVPRNNDGVALASDDTDASNDWAQQNVFEFEAEADSPPDPVEFTFEVNNAGSYVEDVSVVPAGLDAGAVVKVTPDRMRIAPRSRGYFRVRAELSERLLYANCGKDIDFRLEVLRLEDHAQERWGASRYVIKPRFRTETVLNGGLMPERLTLFGHVSPDVGAQDVLLQIQRVGRPTVWTRVPLGPASTFDFEIEDDFPANEEVRAVAYFDGSFEHAKSRSKPVSLTWQVQG
ncbi:hypothetical protein [Pelagibius sp. Alg239-R121]|uniref:hypothetical protein n=1 Tax=Pelagibius sp. Alg239-R121 TaxID=2993448 RepID=UPI0024A6E82F|nr:hypothetical protein [Pelagibius sp. Alg239-R121]